MFYFIRLVLFYTLKLPYHSSIITSFHQLFLIFYVFILFQVQFVSLLWYLPGPSFSCFSVPVLHIFIFINISLQTCYLEVPFSSSSLASSIPVWIYSFDSTSCSSSSSLASSLINYISRSPVLTTLIFSIIQTLSDLDSISYIVPCTFLLIIQYPWPIFWASSVLKFCSIRDEYILSVRNCV